MRSEREASEKDLQKAMESSDPMQAWHVFRSAWENEISLEMTSGNFEWIFNRNTAADEACYFIGESRFAANQLRTACARFTWTRLRDSDVLRVWAAAMGPDHVVKTWKGSRNSLPFGMRGELAGGMVASLAQLQGREWLRDKLPEIFDSLDWNEEEQESLIRELADRKVLNGLLLARLGPQANGIYERLVTGRRIKPYDLNPASSLPLAGVAAKEPALAHRLADLLKEVQIATDLRDAGLSGDEYAAAQLSSLGLRGHWKDWLRHFPLDVDLRWPLTTLDGWGHASQSPVIELGFPLIQILHVCSILDAPEFRKVVANAADYWQPEYLLYLLGREGVSYWPELRLAGNTDRRWRARWVEQAGEAIAILFFERALGLELSTLNRIPESNKEATPDFKASCNTGPLVFETKGSSNWGKHHRQRKDALAQLGKVGTDSGTGWAAQGRSFAASLFAAVHGDRRDTLFYVQDPPFAFEHLFGEGWRAQARRRHYAGVLEACGMFEAADDYLNHGEFPFRESSTFRLPSSNGGEAIQFIGSYSGPAEVARQLGHPRPQTFRGLKIFRGVDRRCLDDLSSLPRAKDRGDFEVSKVGVLPVSGDSQSKSLERRTGVYSLLSNGAILAILWDPA